MSKRKSKSKTTVVAPAAKAVPPKPDAHALVPGPKLRQLLGVSPVTLWRWRHDESMDFPAAKLINGRTYFPWGQVAAWLDRQQETP